MKKKTIIVLCSVVAAAAVAAFLCIKFLGGNADSDSSSVSSSVIDSSASTDTSIGTTNRFAGVVESQETWSVQQNSEKTVKDILVTVGQEVKAGDVLFTYDTEKFSSDLSQAQIDLERINNEISSLNSAIAELEKEKKSASADNQATYTLQIQEQQLSVKQKEFDAQSKQLEIDKLNENINNATVTSEIDGVVKSINSGTGSDSYSGDDSSFITVMKTGDLRIKGTINELNIGSLVVGSEVIVHSRIDENQTWKGTVTKIDTEKATSSSSSYAYYGDSSSAETTSTSYPFYVDLESSDGLMMGQHVYVEVVDGTQAGGDFEATEDVQEFFENSQTDEA